MVEMMNSWMQKRVSWIRSTMLKMGAQAEAGAELLPMVRMMVGVCRQTALTEIMARTSRSVRLSRTTRCRREKRTKAWPVTMATQPESCFDQLCCCRLAWWVARERLPISIKTRKHPDGVSVRNLSTKPNAWKVHPHELMRSEQK